LAASPTFARSSTQGNRAPVDNHPLPDTQRACNLPSATIQSAADCFGKERTSETRAKACAKQCRAARSGVCQVLGRRERNLPACPAAANLRRRKDGLSRRSAVPLRSPDALKCSSAQPQSSTAARRGRGDRACAGEKSDLARTRARPGAAAANRGAGGSSAQTPSSASPRDTTAGTSRQRRFRLADAWTSAHAYSPHLTRPSQSVRPSHSTISLGPPTPRTHRTE
jgi:hypothetical protein